MRDVLYGTKQSSSKYRMYWIILDSWQPQMQVKLDCGFRDILTVCWDKKNTHPLLGWFITLPFDSNFLIIAYGGIWLFQCFCFIFQPFLLCEAQQPFVAPHNYVLCSTHCDEGLIVCTHQTRSIAFLALDYSQGYTLCNFWLEFNIYI